MHRQLSAAILCLGRIHRTDPSAALVGTWTAQFDVADMMNETMDFETDLSLYASMTFIFRSDSTVEYIMEISPDDYFDFIVKASEEQIYLQAQQDGMTKEDVDAMFQMTMGMTVSEYVVAYVNESAEVLQEAMDDMNTHETGVYYVEDNQLFVGDDLDSCDGTPYTLSGNTLTIMDSESDMAITLSRTAN